VTRDAFALENGLDASKFWVGLLPGSRTRELDANLPTMFEAARLLGPGYEYLLPVAPTLQETQVELLAAQAKGVAVRVVHDARAVLQHARASIVASGTATVEAALIGNPFVVVYRVSRITYAVAQRVVRVAHVGMVNLIAGRRIVPELIQHDFTASKVVAELRPLLENEEARATMQSDLRTVGAALRVNSEGAIKHAARIALELIPAAEQPRLQSAFVSSWPAE
jgi:lipid-A-disaccharide synthase